MNRIRRMIAGSALALTALTGGALGANLISSAGAATSSSSSSTGATSSSGSAATGDPARPTPDWSKGGHQANGKTEAVLTGDDLTKATAAAEAAVPGGTVKRAETDAEGAAYEVHMTKSDGSVVTVKLDSSFKVTSTIDGMG